MKISLLNDIEYETKAMLKYCGLILNKIVYLFMKIKDQLKLRVFTR